MKALFTTTALLFCAFAAAAQSHAAKLWYELKEKRESLPALHQGFDIARTFKLASGEQSSKWQIFLDASHGQWREKNLSGCGSRVRIFDGTDLLVSEEGEDEFVRVKRKSKDERPAPAVYGHAEPGQDRTARLLGHMVRSRPRGRARAR